jgi:hypothetical protein
MNIADMSIITFHAESALLRLEKLTAAKGEAATSIQADIVRTYISDASDAINKAGKDALNSFAEGDELKMMHIGLKRFTKTEPFNTKEARRRICAQLVADDGYKL